MPGWYSLPTYCLLWKDTFTRADAAPGPTALQPITDNELYTFAQGADDDDYFGLTDGHVSHDAEILARPFGAQSASLSVAGLPSEKIALQMSFPEIVNPTGGYWVYQLRYGDIDSGQYVATFYKRADEWWTFYLQLRKTGESNYTLLRESGTYAPIVASLHNLRLTVHGDHVFAYLWDASQSMPTPGSGSNPPVLYQNMGSVIWTGAFPRSTQCSFVTYFEPSTATSSSTWIDDLQIWIPCAPVPVHVTTDGANARYATRYYKFRSGVPVAQGLHGQLQLQAGATASRLADDVLYVGLA